MGKHWSLRLIQSPSFDRLLKRLMGKLFSQNPQQQGQWTMNPLPRGWGPFVKQPSPCKSVLSMQNTSAQPEGGS
jgi:hypothetical protein